MALQSTDHQNSQAQDLLFVHRLYSAWTVNHDYALVNYLKIVLSLIAYSASDGAPHLVQQSCVCVCVCVINTEW